MSKNSYKIGEIVNPLDIRSGHVIVKGRVCRIKIPARVNTFLCHHHYFTNPPRPQIYPVNSINFAVSKFTVAEVRIRNDDKVIINSEDKYSAIIEHAVRITQKTLDLNMGFEVSAKNLHGLSHGGLGSSSAIASAVVQAINILTGNTLSVQDITKLISQNYGEESIKKGFLSTAASVGGSTAIGLSGKSLIIMGGESKIWYSGNLSKGYSAILLYPKKIKAISNALDKELNRKEFSLLKTVDAGWEDIKENLLKNEIISSVSQKDFSSLFKYINFYTIGAFGDIPNYFNSRWLAQGVEFKSLIYLIFSKLFGESLRINENCFFVSSNGPLIAIITKYPNVVLKLLEDLGRDFTVEKVELCDSISYELTE